MSSCSSINYYRLNCTVKSHWNRAHNAEECGDTWSSIEVTSDRVWRCLLIEYGGDFWSSIEVTEQVWRWLLINRVWRWLLIKCRGDSWSIEYWPHMDPTWDMSPFGAAGLCCCRCHSTGPCWLDPYVWQSVWSVVRRYWWGLGEEPPPPPPWLAVVWEVPSPNQGQRRRPSCWEFSCPITCLTHWLGVNIVASLC